MTQTSSTKIKWNFDLRHWEGITVEQVKVWEGLYPDVDVVNVLTVDIPRWLDKVEGTKKANKLNWKSFIVRWLKKDQMKAIGIL